MSLPDVERDIATYFTTIHKESGRTPLGVGWNGEASQRIRFEQLCKIIDPAEPYSINDLGCGYGALHDYLLQIGTSPDYAGYDVSEAMIDGARQHLAGRENVALECSGKPLRLADYSVASGLFNVRVGRPDVEWQSFIIATLDEMNRNSGKAFSFNALTKYSDPEKCGPICIMPIRLLCSIIASDIIPEMLRYSMTMKSMTSPFWSANNGRIYYEL